MRKPRAQSLDPDCQWKILGVQRPDPNDSSGIDCSMIAELNGVLLLSIDCVRNPHTLKLGFSCHDATPLGHHAKALSALVHANFLPPTKSTT